MHVRKVIDGKVYDTEKGTRVAEYSARYVPDEDDGPDDFAMACHNIDEALYRTANGSWFLAGSGGAFTRYATPATGVLNAMQPGEGVVPLSEVEARQWCERHAVEEGIFERHFPVEDA